MNQSPVGTPRPTVRLIPDENPWEGGKCPERPALPLTLLLSLLCAAFAVAPCFLARMPGYALLPLTMCVAYLLFAARSVMTILSAAALFAIARVVGKIFIIAGISGVSAQSFGVGAVCVLCAVSLGALLIATVRSPWLLLIPAAVFPAALLLSGEIVPAVCVLLIFPVAGGLAFSTMKNRPRVAVICTVSVLVCFFGLFAGALLWYRAAGKIAIDTVFDMIFTLRDMLVAALRDALSSTQATAALGDKAEQATTVLVTLIEQSVVILPALVVTVANLFAYSAQLMCNYGFRAVGCPGLITITSRIFCMSATSAAIYLVCTVACLLARETTLAIAVMENLQLMLFPGMVIVGLWRLVANLHARRSGWFAVMLLIGVFVAPTVVLLVLSVSGAFTTLFRPIFLRFLPTPPPSGGSGGGSDSHDDRGRGDNESSGDDRP